ncbi:MAG: hypothetical protein AAFO03_11385 [Bacteroidota bacterium]
MQEDSKYTFFVQGGELWLELTHKRVEAKKIELVSRQLGEAKVSSCTQSPGEGNAIKLSIVLHFDGRNKTYHFVVQDPAGLLESPQIRLRASQHVLSNDVPVNKITHSNDGLFVSTQNGDAFYVQSSTGRAEVTMLKSNNGPLDDILAAKAGIVTFLDNFATELPNIAGAVEKKVVKTVLDKFGNQIKAVETELKTLFDKSLSDLISNSNDEQSSQKLMANFSAATSKKKENGNSSRQAVHALLLKKIDVGRYLNGFAYPPMITSAVPVTGVKTSDGSDPIDKLGKLFEPFASLLNAATLVKLTGMAADDLLKVLSGSQPFSSLVEDFFKLFKVDEIMAQLNTVLSGGQVSKLLGEIGLKAYLDAPINNDFFQAFYEHFFPGKKCTVLDLIAFLMAIVAFTTTEILGKENDFHDTFNKPQNLAALTGLPADLIKIIGGTSAAAPLAFFAVPQAADTSSGAEIAYEVIGSVGAVLLTLTIGVAGVFSYGTGLIASSVVGGVAGAIGQTVGGLGFKRSLVDTGANLAGGFIGGFAGSFVATLVGNKLFGIWAQKGATPTARLKYLRMIMAGSAITLGGGGGGVISSVIKTKIETGQVKFNDVISLTAGITAGLGGGAMGCGLHFMGALSGSSCLPVPISTADATARRMVAIAPAAPAVMNNASPIPLPVGHFPVPLPGYSMGVYPTIFDDHGAVPSRGMSFALVQNDEFTRMDNSYGVNRQKLFWLEAGAAGAAPPANQQVDMIIGVHGIGRYVFPCFVHERPNGGLPVNFSRPFYKDDFAAFVNADAQIQAFFRTIAGRLPRIKLAVCFSALPIGCCSLGQKLATTLNAEVYAGRPPVIPYLNNGNPVVPGWGGWVKYTP